jgi:hypothetical protein
VGIFVHDFTHHPSRSRRHQPLIQHIRRLARRS